MIVLPIPMMRKLCLLILLNSSKYMLPTNNFEKAVSNILYTTSVGSVHTNKTTITL